MGGEFRKNFKHTFCFSLARSFVRCEGGWRLPEATNKPDVLHKVSLELPPDWQADLSGTIRGGRFTFCVPVKKIVF